MYCYEKLGSNKSNESTQSNELRRLITRLRLETVLNNKEVAGRAIKMGDEHHQRSPIQNVIQFVHQYSIKHFIQLIKRVNRLSL